MRITFKIDSRSLYALAYSFIAMGTAIADGYISPEMVNIPEGTFLMGSNNGHISTRPVREEKVDKFRMSKYPITVAEFRKYVEDTGVNLEYDCKDHLGKNWLYTPDNEHGGARWDEHRFLKSEYQPVTCASWKMANNYAQWLSNKTGVEYRLPTNIEFEYALKANTTSRYFWGDDPGATQVCKYGNIADQTGEYFPSNEYGASYVGFLGYANCNDYEPYVSIVGLYRPNPFGLYDMVGNVNQLTSSCFPEEGQLATGVYENCKDVWHRGESWHFPPQPHSYGWKLPKSRATTSAAMGFRLVAQGHSDEIHKSTKELAVNLAKAQKQRIAERKVIPDAPLGLQLNHIGRKQFELSWQSSSDVKVIGYEVYQSNSKHAHLMGGFYKEHYSKIAKLKKMDSSVLVEVPDTGVSYKVVAKTKRLTSLPSKPKVVYKPLPVSIPGTLKMEDAASISGGYLKHRKATEEKPELYYLSYFGHHLEQLGVTADFIVKVEETGWYLLNYIGSSDQNGAFFKLWQGNTFVGDIRYDSDVDDTVSKRHRIYLEKGQHVLQAVIKRTGGDYYGLGWLKFTKE